MESLPAEISGIGPNVYTTVEKKRSGWQYSDFVPPGFIHYSFYLIN